jgi:hypothetical protein
LSEEKKNDKGKEIVLASGRVLKNAYIISRTPAGLNIGHETGVVFVPFSEMSKERQKKYNYDPKKAQEYLERRKEAQQRRAVRLAKKKAEEEKDEDEDDSFDFEYDEFPQLSPLDQLQKELNYLLRERDRLERLYSKVKNSPVAPRGGPSYSTYRGGKITSYTQQHQQNSLDKRRRLKEISGELQRNKRRTTTVRNLISRAKTKGIKRGKTIR